MRIRASLRRRHRPLWVVVALFGLLFQQLAMAAYACPSPATMAQTAMTTGDCAAMGMSQSHQAQTRADPRCIEHCAHHVPAQADVQAPTVPPLALPFASPLNLGTVAMATTRQVLPDPVQQPPEAPPPLRFCTLLI